MGMSHADCTHPRTPAGRATCRKDRARHGIAQGVDRTVMMNDLGDPDDVPEPMVITEDIVHTECVRMLDAGQPDRARNTPRKPAVRVVPRTRGDGGVVAGTRRARKAVTVDLKRPGTRIRGRADMPDVPRVFSNVINLSIDKGWEVIVGEVFNPDNRRIIIRTDKGDLNLSWSSTNPNGLQQISWRPANTSVTTVISTLNGGLRMAMGEDE